MASLLHKWSAAINGIATPISRTIVIGLIAIEFSRQICGKHFSKASFFKQLFYSLYYQELCVFDRQLQVLSFSCYKALMFVPYRVH